MKNWTKENRIILFFLIVALIGGIIVVFISANSFFSSGQENSFAQFNDFAGRENPDDVCAVPLGTDPQEWQDHLSHHPDLYASCLNDGGIKNEK